MYISITCLDAVIKKTVIKTLKTSLFWFTVEGTVEHGGACTVTEAGGGRSYCVPREGGKGDERLCPSHFSFMYSQGLP